MLPGSVPGAGPCPEPAAGAQRAAATLTFAPRYSMLMDTTSFKTGRQGPGQGRQQPSLVEVRGELVGVSRPRAARQSLEPQLPQRMALSGWPGSNSHATSQASPREGLSPGPGSSQEAPRGPSLRLCLPEPDQRSLESQVLPEHLFIALFSEQWRTSAPGWAPPAPPQKTRPRASRAPGPSRWGWAGGPHLAGGSALLRTPVCLSVDELLQGRRHCCGSASLPHPPVAQLASSPRAQGSQSALLARPGGDTDRRGPCPGAGSAVLTGAPKQSSLITAE